MKSMDFIALQARVLHFGNIKWRLAITDQSWSLLLFKSSTAACHWKAPRGLVERAGKEPSKTLRSLAAAQPGWSLGWVLAVLAHRWGHVGGLHGSIFCSISCIYSISLIRKYSGGIEVGCMKHASRAAKGADWSFAWWYHSWHSSSIQSCCCCMMEHTWGSLSG